MEAAEFLKADAAQRESIITETERQLHLAKQFVRFSKMQKLVRNAHTVQMLEKYKMQCIKLMEHEHV